MAVREVAPLVGAGRESTGRVLTQLEAVGWVMRKRGDAASASPDLWAASHDAAVAWLEGAEYVGQDERAHGELVYSVDDEPRQVALPRLDPLPAGQLQQLVLEVLDAAAEVEFGPVQVARLLGGRSQGAVSNSLERLVAAGLALRTCQAPRRYRAVRER